jgi:hypothetical protein
MRDDIMWLVKDMNSERWFLPNRRLRERVEVQLVWFAMQNLLISGYVDNLPQPYQFSVKSHRYQEIRTADASSIFISFFLMEKLTKRNK